MTVTLARRADICLSSFKRVAWEEEAVSVSVDARAAVTASRERFIEFVAAHPQRKFYGVNVHAGEGSDRRLSESEQRDYARGLHAGTSFGEPLPKRVVRGIAFARLANFIEGHSAVSAELVEFVAEMLDGRPLPPVPRYGNGGAGEIQALGWLYGDVGEHLSLGLKEGMALINGSPCAPALLADAALSAELMIGLFEAVACMAAAALGVPAITYDARLEQLWGDPFQSRALADIRSALAGADTLDDHEHPQPPVCFRILPRVVGNALRVLAAACDAAEIALPAVSDNPVFLTDEIVSNGGFHNAAAPACIDSLTFALADFAQLAQHMVQRLQTDPRALPGLDSLALGTMQMVAGGYAEEARAAAVPSLLPLSGYGQTDVPAPGFFAFNRFERVRGFLVGSLTCLAALAGHALAEPGRVVPPALEVLHRKVIVAVPPAQQRRTLGPELDRLAAILTPEIPD